MRECNRSQQFTFCEAFYEVNFRVSKYYVFACELLVLDKIISAKPWFVPLVSIDGTRNVCP